MTPDDAQFFFMKFFRNLARARARYRLAGGGGRAAYARALVPVVLGIEESLLIEDADDTPAEVSEAHDTTREA